MRDKTPRLFESMNWATGERTGRVMKRPATSTRGGASLIAVMSIALLSMSSAAQAEADGPDWWTVTGVGANDVLNIRAEPAASAEKIGKVPTNAQGLRNLGCTGEMSFDEWEKATETEREQARFNRWCKIRYAGTTGWVAGRYLTEGAPPQDDQEIVESGEYSFGAWSVFCESGLCNSAYQYGRGGSVPTILRVKRGMDESPEILVEGGPFTPSGEVAFLIDGEFVTGGLASTLQAGSGDDLVFPPDDITYALARRMRLGTTMVLTVPRAQGSETVEFDLDGFEEALRQVQKP